jgi:hypothetical protein
MGLGDDTKEDVMPPTTHTAGSYPNIRRMI